MVNKDKKILMYSVVKGSKEVIPVEVDKVTKQFVFKTNYKNNQQEKHKIKGEFRRFYDTKASANKAALNGW